MSTVQAVFEDKRAAYEQYVREHWHELADWEREQYSQFAWATADRRRVEGLLATPKHAPGTRPRFAGETLPAASGLPKTVALAYALAIVGIVFFPYILELAALALALVNIACRKWDHALLQVGIALLTLTLAMLGHSASPHVVSFVQAMLRG